MMMTVCVISRCCQAHLDHRFHRNLSKLTSMCLHSCARQSINANVNASLRVIVSFPFFFNSYLHRHFSLFLENKEKQQNIMFRFLCGRNPITNNAYIIYNLFSFSFRGNKFLFTFFSWPYGFSLLMFISHCGVLFCYQYKRRFRTKAKDIENEAEAKTKQRKTE